MCPPPLVFGALKKPGWDRVNLTRTLSVLPGTRDFSGDSAARSRIHRRIVVLLDEKYSVSEVCSHPELVVPAGGEAADTVI